MRVFISRNLNPNAPFRQLLEEGGHTVHGQSLLEFRAAPFPNSLPEADWYFFYSKNGVRYLFEHIEQNGATIPQVRWATIGPKTALMLKEHIPVIDFMGNGNPEDTALAFKEIALGQSVVFVQAEQSRRSVESLLPDNIQCKQLIAYRNKAMDTPPDLTQFDSLVFTSPLNAQTYFSKYKKKEKQHIIAIGNTTAQALRALGLTVHRIAHEASEIGLAKAILSKK